MLNSFSHDAVADALREAARLDVLPRFKMLQDHEIMEKNPGDVVTVADIEAEHRLTRLLPDILPGSVVVGEEAHSKDPMILQKISGDEPVWLVDPVDGTKNFTNGNPLFCIMVALVYRGETVNSWILDPTRDRLAHAGKGEGAWLDGSQLKVKPRRAVGEMVGQINFGVFPSAGREESRDHFKSLFAEVSRLSCAGHDFLAQAEGSRDFALYKRLWSWDHAPGVLLLREAGGYVALLDKRPYRVQDRVELLLSARDEDGWYELKALFDAASATI